MQLGSKNKHNQVLRSRHPAFFTTTLENCLVVSIKAKIKQFSKQTNSQSLSPCLDNADCSVCFSFWIIRSRGRGLQFCYLLIAAPVTELAHGRFSINVDRMNEWERKVNNMHSVWIMLLNVFQSMLCTSSSFGTYSSGMILGSQWNSQKTRCPLEIVREKKKALKVICFNQKNQNSR